MKTIKGRAAALLVIVALVLAAHFTFRWLLEQPDDVRMPHYPFVAMMCDVEGGEHFEDASCDLP